MVFIILWGYFSFANDWIIRECECTYGAYGSYYVVIYFSFSKQSIIYTLPNTTYTYTRGPKNTPYCFKIYENTLCRTKFTATIKNGSLVIALWLDVLIITIILATHQLFSSNVTLKIEKQQTWFSNWISGRRVFSLSRIAIFSVVSSWFTTSGFPSFLAFLTMK